MSTSKKLAITWLKADEGLVLQPYKCSANKTTIGYGRNLEDCGINEDEANFLLINDYDRAELDAVSFIGAEVFVTLSEERKAVLVCMAFNLGLTRLNKFVKFKAAIKKNDFDEASRQMLDSKWSRQVGARSHRLASFML